MTFWAVVGAVMLANLLWLAGLLVLRMVIATWQSTEPWNTRRAFNPGGTAKRVEHNWRRAMGGATERGAGGGDT